MNVKVEEDKKHCCLSLNVVPNSKTQKWRERKTGSEIKTIV